MYVWKVEFQAPSRTEDPAYHSSAMHENGIVLTSDLDIREVHVNLAAIIDAQGSFVLGAVLKAELIGATLDSLDYRPRSSS